MFELSISSILIFLLIYISTSLTRALYNITLHPLSHFPGPKLHGAFYFPLYWHNYTGNLATVTKDLHNAYGNIVRMSPSSLSFTSPEAVQDIYTHPPNAKPLQKDPELYHDLPGFVGSDIIIADTKTHARYRRLLGHAFSVSALASQESLITTYTTLLTTRLASLSRTRHQKIDIAAWLNFATFDIISDLTFGVPFGGLLEGEYHPWISAIFENVRVLALMRSLRAYAVSRVVVALLLRLPAVKREIGRMRVFTESRTRERLVLGVDAARGDFMSYVLKYNDESGMDTEELISSSRVILAAGSETTATALCGLVFYLLTTPRCLQLLQNEIRDEFNCVEDMSFEREARLVYLQACIQEVLRVYPPVAMELSRLTPPEGCVIGSVFVPGGTAVAAPHIATSLSSLNFTNPTSFVPERWLGDSGYKNDRLSASQPFSLGARSCVGENLALAEIRSIIVRLLWHFDMELCEESVRWREQKAFLLWEKGPLWVRIRERKV